jgi:hypothetical protein
VRSDNAVKNRRIFKLDPYFLALGEVEKAAQLRMIYIFVTQPHLADFAWADVQEFGDGVDADDHPPPGEFAGIR